MERKGLEVNFTRYLKAFENDFIVDAIERKVIGKNTLHKVPLRKGKLHPTPFGHFLDTEFDYSVIYAINYFGYFKLSTGLKSVARATEEMFPNLKTILAPVIYFDSIRKEHLKIVAPLLADDFHKFKSFLIKKRRAK